MNCVEVDGKGCGKLPKGWSCLLQTGHPGYCLVRAPLTVEEAAARVLEVWIGPGLYPINGYMDKAMKDLERAMS